MLPAPPIMIPKCMRTENAIYDIKVKHRASGPVHLMFDALMVYGQNDER